MTRDFVRLASIRPQGKLENNSTHFRDQSRPYVTRLKQLQTFRRDIVLSSSGSVYWFVRDLKLPTGWLSRNVGDSLPIYAE